MYWLVCSHWLLINYYLQLRDMEIEIISFGKISEFISNQKLNVSGISNTDELKIHLEQKFPALAGIKYKLALNKNIVQSRQALANHDIVAIMPPFSGG